MEAVAEPEVGMDEPLLWQGALQRAAVGKSDELSGPELKPALPQDFVRPGFQSSLRFAEKAAKTVTRA